MDRFYKILFVAYAPFFLIYVVGGAIAGFAGRAFGVSPDRLWFVYFPAFVGIGLLLLAVRWAAARLVTWRARSRSQNPDVAILEEVNTLVFKSGAFVEYSSAKIVRALTRGITSMTFEIGYAGNLSNVSVVRTGGCTVDLRHSAGSSGAHVVVGFDRSLPTHRECAFEFVLSINNSNALVRRFLRKVNDYMPERSLVQTLIVEDVPSTRFVESTYRSASAHDPIKEVIKISADARHDFAVASPVHGYSYKIAVQGS